MNGEGPPSMSSAEERWELSRQYGDSFLARCALRSCSDSLHKPGCGFFAFRRVGLFSRLRRRVFLGDPICSHDSMPGFMATASEEPSIFIGLSASAAGEAVRLGIPVAAFGKLHDLDPTSFDLSLPNRKGLRRKLSQSVRAGVSIEEERRKPTDPALQAVSDRWLSGRKSKELGLIVTPFPGGLEPDVRLFVARQGAAIVGFASFDPCYTSGRVVGYSLGHLRFLDHPPGTTVHLLLAALRAFGSQGIPRMSLGLAPLSGVSQSTNKDELPTSTWGRLFFRWWYEHGTFLYSFRGIERFKDSFRAHTSAVYVAASRGGSPLDLAVAAHALQLQAF